ncbi:hypothetical protein PIROE2DRAFT_10141 [Piromyces sp. E2]|nr:hypothetical protein PIROE2DRAFT_10141 [Piromyces sp. E2]|eukprot:OUM63355.1 hypothetical protein PIROE2DRAFT_10141 [Piromyces sp. E2]
MIGTEENPGKEAKTLVEVVKRGIFHPILCTDNSTEHESQENPKDLAMEATLVKLYPYTGRTHQLRVHLQSIGHPIIGDYNYEVPFTDHERMMLHAWKINMPLSVKHDNALTCKKSKGMVKKIKIDNENKGETANLQDNIEPSNKRKNDLEDIILETENPFENSITEK